MPRSLSRNPIFDVVLTMDDRSVISGLAEEHGFIPVEIDTPGSLFDMLLYINLADKRLEVALNYNTDLYRLETIKSFSERLTFLLQQCSLHPEQTIAQLLQ